MQTLEKPSRSGSFWGPQSETGSEVKPKLGKEEVKAAATPSLLLGLGSPQPFPQKSIRRGSHQRGAALSAVLTPGPHHSSLRPRPSSPLRKTAILWSLPDPRGRTMETDFPSSSSSSRVCVGSRQWTTWEGALWWDGARVRACPPPPAGGRGVNGSLSFPSWGQRVYLYSYSSPGHNLRWSF